MSLLFILNPGLLGGNDFLLFPHRIQGVDKDHREEIGDALSLV
jgi:hypothetical protein